VLVGWTHPYAPLGTPLVDRDLGKAVVTAFLDHLAHDQHLPRLLLLPYCPEDGPLAQALGQAVAARGGKAASFARHQRALLAPHDASTRAQYLDGAIGAKKRKELRRQRKRLADDGVVMCDTASAPAAVVAALADFLVLEAAGWKGRAGTAALDDGEVSNFVTTALGQLAAEGKASVDRIFVGGKPIAAVIVLRSGATAWCWKIAYDERFARASPGVQLLCDLTQRLLDDPTVARGDSCATADHPMIDRIWRERLPLSDRLIDVRPNAASTFEIACTLEQLRRSVIRAGKSARNALRGG
jgi:hypothetical protein